MKIEHIAIRTRDLEKMRSFYEMYFDAQAGEVYTNPKKQFTSRFLTFTSGCRIELMQYGHTPQTPRQPGQPQTGYAHLAFSVGSQAAVDALTQRLVHDGFEKLDGPRVTGDGYYESAIRDPDGNVIEITV